MIKRIFKYIFTRNNSNQIYILNLNLRPNISQKRVLISYLTKQFNINFDKVEVSHPNINEVNIIIAYFIEKGFVIDVVYCNDEHFINKNQDKKYDVIFGFGKVFRFFSDRTRDALRIIYCTENAPKIAFEKESERVSNYNYRNNKNIKTERAFTYYNEEDFKISNFAILLQNHYNAMNFRDLINKDKTFLLNTTGLKNENYFLKRILNETKANFIWIGSRGIIHKGLDLLVEAFAITPNLNLHILGLSKKERVLLPRKLTKNIHIHGFVKVSSDKFIKIVNSCSFCLLPSCSEAMATSVLTGMRHGLIPIITKDTGIDLEGYGYYFDSLEIESIKQKLLHVSKTENYYLDNKHNSVFKFANSEYNLQRFNESFIEIMNNIII
ncbi:glycosyltransferase [uncultured Polaribacter sp.]|uniref:glycosyltransferase n=1 Tax=uncultured Polaribacter sp. TaxID=174711 RepID=UPI002631CEAC|nr:glycosyltransferase [uncultured Polaribacter sp.]